MDASPETPAELLIALRQHSLFKRTDNEQFLQELTLHMQPRVYNQGDVIITKGEQAKAMFFLLRGRVKVCSKDHERVYATLHQGTCFGEIGILYAMPRTASVLATEKCTVAALTSDQVHQLLPQFPDVEQVLRFEAEERLAILSKSTTPALSPSSSAAGSPTGTLALTPVDTHSPSNLQPRSRRSSIQFNIDTFTKTNIRYHLENIPFFQDCSDEFLHLICLSIQPRHYEPAVVLFEHGQQGDEMYFIIDGTVDIKAPFRPHEQRGPGCYFGDENLLLNMPYAMTVKAVTSVEAYVLNRFNLQQVCDLYPDMTTHLKTKAQRKLSHLEQDPPHPDPPPSHKVVEPQAVCTTTCDQDPTLPIDQLRQMEKKRRRASVAVWNDPYLMNLLEKQASKPASSLQQTHGQGQAPLRMMLEGTQFIQEKSDASPPLAFWDVPQTPPADTDDHLDSLPPDLCSLEPPSPPCLSTSKAAKKPRQPTRRCTTFTSLDRSIMARIVDYLDYRTLLQFMATTRSMRSLFADDLFLRHVDLSTAHKYLTDQAFICLIPALRHRLRSLSLAQCFHLTDTGLRALAMALHNNSSPDSKSWITLRHLHALDLSSCWLLTDQSLQLLGDACPYLTRLDLSNCRKVTHAGMYRFLEAKQQHIDRSGHVEGIGLTWLSVSYCKNMNDLTMQHLADYCSDTLQYLNLQRCTRITDSGFSSWAATSFRQFRTLVLTDCSFLTDRAIDLLTMAAPTLRCLNLSFCCALSDATLAHLTRLSDLSDLDLSFCGAAVSDASLAFFLKHQERQGKLQKSVAPLQRLNLRGCVRLTGQGLFEALSSLPSHLLYLNVSQCPAVTPATKQNIMNLDVIDHLDI
ncbi:RNI-like protein [Hesseltinella vesiculosa]|uniref:RNI-like protein n=1 Tax=Hesseltinella vesiculosa TaxID=101127 RepID=A0A1X2GI43_9FUNG|nr:RNI-like protein [Hesseltinella vesiculosa]